MPVQPAFEAQPQARSEGRSPAQAQVQAQVQAQGQARSQARSQAEPPSQLQAQLRPVRAEDRAAMRHFVQALSPESRGLRFHGGVKADSERLLTHLTQADGLRHIAYVAVLACDDGELIVGEARVVGGSAGEPAELAIVVADAWQGRGLARQLLDTVLAAAAEAGLQAVVGEVLAHNARMACFMERAGFVAVAGCAGGVQRWERSLAAPEAPAQPGQGRLFARLAQLARLARPGWRLGAGRAPLAA